jgi:hypothetical protein
VIHKEKSSERCETLLERFGQRGKKCKVVNVNAQAIAGLGRVERGGVRSADTPKINWYRHAFWSAASSRRFAAAADLSAARRGA